MFGHSGAGALNKTGYSGVTASVGKKELVNALGERPMPWGFRSPPQSHWLRDRPEKSLMWRIFLLTT
jgi:hypothetical protein